MLSQNLVAGQLKNASRHKISPAVERQLLGQVKSIGFEKLDFGMMKSVIQGKFLPAVAQQLFCLAKSIGFA